MTPSYSMAKLNINVGETEIEECIYGMRLALRYLVDNLTMMT